MINKLKHIKPLLVPIIIGIALAYLASLIENKTEPFNIKFTLFIGISIMLNLISGSIGIYILRNHKLIPHLVFLFAYCISLIIVFCILRWVYIGHISDNWINIDTLTILLGSIIPVFIPITLVQTFKLGLGVPVKVFRSHEINHLVNLSAKSGLDKGKRQICIYQVLDKKHFSYSGSRTYHYFQNEPTIHSVKRFLLSLKSTHHKEFEAIELERVKWSVFTRNRLPWSAFLEDLCLKRMNGTKQNELVPKVLQSILKNVNNPLERILLKKYQIDPFKSNSINKIKNRDHIYILKHT